MLHGQSLKLWEEVRLNGCYENKNMMYHSCPDGLWCCYTHSWASIMFDSWAAESHATPGGKIHYKKGLVPSMAHYLTGFRIFTMPQINEYETLNSFCRINGLLLCAGQRLWLTLNYVCTRLETTLCTAKTATDKCKLCAKTLSGEDAVFFLFVCFFKSILINN